MDIFLDKYCEIHYKVVMKIKKSKKNPINFNDFWNSLKIEATRKGLRKVEWMTQSSIPYQRYSEFEQQTRDISARYFLKLIGGLNLKQENIEKTLGRKMTDEQKRLLKFEALVDANRDWLEKLLSDPEMIKLCKRVVITD